jgi:ADP-heptose:LPS heptosyltransferase
MAVKPPHPYVYKSALKRAAAHVLDAVGDLLMAPPPEAVDWKAVKKIAVLRLDHLGDVIHCLPALELLRRALPKAQIHLFTGPWGREAARMSGLADKVVVFEAPWFFRPVRVEWPWSSIRELGARLKSGGYDAALEMRGDLRHHLALWLSGIPVRAGHAITAGKFLLTHPAVWKP